MGCGLWVVGCGSWVVGVWVVGCGVWGCGSCGGNTTIQVWEHDPFLYRACFYSIPVILSWGLELEQEQGSLELELVPPCVLGSG